jgi:hypothetical protein
MAIFHKKSPITTKGKDGSWLPFIPPKEEMSCFLCSGPIDLKHGVYWHGIVAMGSLGEEIKPVSGYIFLHKHCASSLAAHLLSDFTRLNLPE